ncbi:MAG: 4Fe-4S dicluster protein [Bacteroidota bacterium]|nr:4Fe-4S dicluster protein [Bacteroidota bacterium]
MKLSIEQQPTQEGAYPQGEGNIEKNSDFEITGDFQRFNACNDIFARAQWDPRIHTAKAMNWFYSMLGLKVKYKSTDGYTQKDYALRNAGWVVANLMMERSAHLNRHDGFLDDIRGYMKEDGNKVPVASEEEISLQIKKAGKLFGADIVGITKIDLRWHYTHKFDAKTLSEKPNELSEELTNCIVIGTSMEYDVVQTYPSALAGTAPALGYSRDVFILQSLSQFIRNMGYKAVSSLNDSAQAIPYAIQAGLAEYGRNGLAITKDYGPRVRFGKIFTNLPLLHDVPQKFGVKEFCEICSKCADACPAKAIPFGMPTDQTHNQSNIKGIKKWTVDGEKCFSIWANQGTECGICVRVCPYNKSNDTWKDRAYFRFFRWLASTRGKRLALWLDDFLGFGVRKAPHLWWKEKEIKY